MILAASTCIFTYMHACMYVRLKVYLHKYQCIYALYDYKQVVYIQVCVCMNVCIAHNLLSRRCYRAYDEFRSADYVAQVSILCYATYILTYIHTYIHTYITVKILHRVSPIQISFLGLPSTTGAPFIDYYIGNSICMYVWKHRCVCANICI